MYKGLYDQFAHWFHDGQGQVYFYSDPHFADDEMQYIRRNYIGDDEQIKRINSKIGKYDTLVILGDIGDVEWVSKIRGYKVLIKGNHDGGASNYKRDMDTIQEFTNEKMTQEDIIKLVVAKTPEQMAEIMDKYTTKSLRDNHLFDEVYEGPLFIAEKILLTHEPVYFPYALNIHGHDHSGWTFNDLWHWNMCAENIDYTPVCLKEILTSGRLKQIADIHRVTIDTATVKSNKKN
jgi:calcineurin-like phosphoesterase family protein